MQSIKVKHSCVEVLIGKVILLVVSVVRKGCRFRISSPERKTTDREVGIELRLGSYQVLFERRALRERMLTGLEGTTHLQQNASILKEKSAARLA